MANNIGDFDLSAVIYGKFISCRADTGAPATLTSGALSVYKDNSTTQSTSGVTFSGDFDSVTGLNHFTIDTSSDGTFYSTGSFFDIIVTTGTVNSVSAVGSCVGQFTICKTSALRPTTALRKLDVSAGGEAGLDWANVGSPTTSLALTGTTIAVTQKVDVDTIKTNPVVNGGTITFPTTATLASTTNITAGTITTATNLTNAPTAGDLTATMKTSVTTAATAATPVAASISGITFPTNFASLVITSGGRVAIQDALQKNTAKAGFPFPMTDSTTHAPKTGVTVTAQRSINAGAFASCTNSPTEISNGVYAIDLSAADLNGDFIMLRFTGTASDDVLIGIATFT